MATSQNITHTPEIHTPPTFSRRRVFSFAPAVVAAALAAKAQAQQTDPLIELVARWKRFHHAFENWIGDEEDDTRDVLFADMSDLAKEIIATPPTSLSGAIAQIEFARDSCLIGDVMPDRSDAAMVESILDRLRVLA